MQNLYIVTSQKENVSEDLNKEEKLSILYHDIFDYPLNFADIIKWKTGKKFPQSNLNFLVSNKNGYYFLEGKEGVVYKKNLGQEFPPKRWKLPKKLRLFCPMFLG